MQIKNKYSVIILSLIFLILNFSIINNQFMYENWMFLGVAVSSFAIFAATYFLNVKNIDHQLSFISLLIFVFYTIHQFEEHGYDIFGHRYSFEMALNNLFAKFNHICEGEKLCPLNPQAIYYININIVWLTILISVVSPKNFFFTKICALSIMSLNAVVHIIPAIIMHKYNPGLATAIIIFIPASIIIYRYILNNFIFPKKYLLIGILWSFLAHIYTVLGSLLTYKFNIFNHHILALTTILFALSPYVIENILKRQLKNYNYKIYK